jgi:hypothetical protein
MADILSGIPLGIEIPGASFPVLRVFTSRDRDVGLDQSIPIHARTLASRISTKISSLVTEEEAGNDLDRHPIAGLQKETFARISEGTTGWLGRIGGIIGSLKRQCGEDSEEFLPSTKRMRLEG